MRPFVVSGFAIFEYASDSLCFGLWSSFIGVVGQGSTLCGALSSCYPPLSPSTFPLFIRVGVGAHGWVVKFCQPAMQSPSRSQQGKPQDVSGTQPPLSNTVAIILHFPPPEKWLELGHCSNNNNSYYSYNTAHTLRG